MSGFSLEALIPPAWATVLKEELRKDYFTALAAKVAEAYEGELPVYPPQHQIFRALELCAPEDVKVIILGQDPYHTPDVANGLAFAVAPEADGGRRSLPPSLKNIFQEVDDDLGVNCAHTADPDLSRWARQGVLLLNTALTVRIHSAGSHRTFGWTTFTSALLREITKKRPNVVVLLWGRHAQCAWWQSGAVHGCVLESSHPSPFSASRGFFGCGHFGKTNEFLCQRGETPIEWCEASDMLEIKK